jgi:zinc transport system permease protein
MLEYLELLPFRRALITLAATGVAFPALGTYILALELVPARFAVMHASLLGAAIGLFFGVSPLAAALVASLAAGAGIARLSERSAASAGGSLGLVMTLSLGLAFILFYKADVNSIEAFSLFWGSVLALSGTELLLTVGGAFAVILVTTLFFREIRAVLYDRVLAAAQGLPSRLVYFGIIMLVCLGIGLAMRVTGALMVDAVTILPALAARSMRRGFRGTLLWGGFFGLAMNFGGFALALALDLPTSPAIIVVGAAIVLATGWAARRSTEPSPRPNKVQGTP